MLDCSQKALTSEGRTLEERAERVAQEFQSIFSDPQVIIAPRPNVAAFR